MKRDNPIKLAVIHGILVIALCTCTLSLGSYAWFNEAITGKPSQVASGNYAIQIQLSQGNQTVSPVDGSVQASGACSYALTKGEQYAVTLQASGTAQTGFAVFTVGEDKHYSPQLAPNEKYTFVVQSATDVVMQFNFQWGSYGASETRIDATLNV